MKLQKLIIKNFKSIKEIEISDFTDLNIFIGKNDAGKTNIIRAIDLALNSNIPQKNNYFKLLSEDGMNSEYEGTTPYLFFDKQKHESEIIAHLKINRRELEHLGLNPDTDEKELVISKKMFSENGNTIISTEFLRINKDIIIKTSDEKNRFLKRSHEYTDNIDDTKALSIMKELSNQFILLPAERNINRDPEPKSEKTRTEQYIKDSLIKLGNSSDNYDIQLFNNFIKLIDKISPLIEIIEPVKENRKITDIKFKNQKGEEIPLSTIGSGNNELLLLLHEIIISANKILAIEEPEIHLHPEAERKLYQFMKEFSEATQILAITHSPVFVEPKNIKGLFRVAKEKNETKIYLMTEKYYLNFDRLEQELNSENCEMFFADKVLLVEGISDKILIEGLIKKYCKSSSEIKVISCFSKDNFEVYVNLLKLFSIPYKIMTDLDSLKGRFKIKIIFNELKKQKKFKNRYEQIDYLKTKDIHVLSKGSLENSYPKRYRRGISKPLDALCAVNNITDEEFYSDRMKDIRLVIQALEK